jgi:hypothetical protein
MASYLGPFLFAHSRKQVEGVSMERMVEKTTETARIVRFVQCSVVFDPLKAAPCLWLAFDN